MNINETISFIQEADWKGSVLGLSRVRELLHRLGDPQKQLRFVHVAGTNGKGSVCAMLSSIFMEAGYRTGLCISPHLKDYNERMQVNGESISDDDMCLVAERVKDALKDMEDVPTEFERVLAMCFLYFLEKKCDIVILEVGLGGRMDATNVIDAPLLSIITNISLDHTEILGDTIAKIAAEKGGIIKNGSRVLMYDQSNEAKDVIAGICDREGAELSIADFESLEKVSGTLSEQVFDYKQYKGLSLGLIGTYQLKNAAVTVNAIDILRSDFDISDEALRSGLRKAVWPGRFEVLCTSPLVIADGAHNPDGVSELAVSIKEYIPNKKIVFLMSVMADKDYRTLIRSTAPYAKEYIASAPDYYRALAPKELAAVIKEETGLPASCSETVTKGMEMAISAAGNEGVVIAFGSLYQMGEVRDSVKSLKGL